MFVCELLSIYVLCFVCWFVAAVGHQSRTIWSSTGSSLFFFGYEVRPETLIWYHGSQEPLEPRFQPDCWCGPLGSIVVVVVYTQIAGRT